MSAPAEARAEVRTEVRYVCGGCKRTVRVYVPALVRCSRCGRPMRADEAESAKP